MKQVWITGKGGSGRLQVRESPTPEPGSGQLRIRVEAAGVNFADVMMRLGLYPDAPDLPAIPGYEVAGVVDAVGAGVDGKWSGKPVVAMCRFGGYSEAVCLPHELVWERPAGVGAVTAAAMPVNYLTAWQMVRVMAPVAAGETVLIHSAAGGVGQALLQLCMLSGARIIGTASESKHARLREQGVDCVLDSRRRDFAAAVRSATGGMGADVVLEPRNGPWIMESYRALAKCGRLVLYGFSDAAVGGRSGTFSALRTLAKVPWVQLNPIRLMNDNKSIAGVNLGRMWDQGARTGAWVASILELMAEGRIAPTIDGVHGFTDAAAAQRRLEERLNFGKVILVPERMDRA